MNTQPVFGSVLVEDIAAFINHKRALGRRYGVEENVLRLFDRFLRAQGVKDRLAITPAVIEAFLASRPRSQPRSYNHLLGVIRRLFRWLVVQERLPNSPVCLLPRRATTQKPPFLFDRAQVSRLLKVAAALPDNPRAPQRGIMYTMMFSLLYGLGLRVGEVSRLLKEDVDLNRMLLVIRETKFSKSRLVPFGPRMAGKLEAYIDRCQQRRGLLRSDSPLFSFVGDGPVNPCTISQTFHQLLPRLELDIPEGVRAPCLHCLRHSFAVNTLLRWYQEGVNPQTRLFRLATFLGHVDPVSTAVYLTITPHLLQEANARFERLAEPTNGEIRS